MVQRRPAPPMGMGVQSCFFMVPPRVACGGGVFGMLVMGGQSCFLWFPPSPLWPVVGMLVMDGQSWFVWLAVCMWCM